MITRPQVVRTATATAVTVAATVAAILVTLVMVHVPGLQSNGSGNAGQAFGAAAGTASVIVLLFAAKSFRQQAQEFRMRREEMAAQSREIEFQRDNTRRNCESAERTAEATVRGQHFALMQLAIQDPVLADVWPAFQNLESGDRKKQYHYINLIISFQCMAHTLNYLSDDEAFEALSYLFTSPIIHSFWKESQPSRSRSTPYGGKMQKFYELADLAFQSRQSIR